MSPIFDRSRRLGLGLVAMVGATMVAPGAARSQTAQDSAAAQPVLPRPEMKPGSPVVEDLVGAPQPALDVRKRPDHVRSRVTSSHHRIRVAHHFAPRPNIERPALAGVELLAPLPRPGEPPHIEVPVPAYPLDTVAAAYLTPVPPIMCHRVPREPDLPDPRLYRERTVVCAPDNP